MQAGQCDNQMGIRFWEVVCDEHGVGGDSEKKRKKLRVVGWHGKREISVARARVSRTA
jgi:hypothetical protein